MEKDTLNAFKLFSRFTESNRQLIFFGIIVGLLAIAFISSSHQIPVVGTNSTNTTYIYATTINSTGLLLDSGNNTPLINEIDEIFWTGNEDGSTWMINVTFTNVTHFNYVEFKYRYFSTIGASTHVNDIEIWCDTTHQFIDLTTFTNQIEQAYFTRNFPDSMHFIRPNGNVTLRINHTENGNANHRIWLDTVRLVQKPQFEKINITNNTYITNGTGGCTGNCSFDKIYVNTLTKNDTTDAYGSYINLTGTGFTAISIVDNIKSRFTLNDGSFFDIISEYIGGSNKSEIFGNPDLLELVVSNGSLNVIDIYHNRTEQIIDSRTYITNSTHMNYDGANITELNETNRVLRLNETNRSLFTNKIDSYKYANNTEVSGVVVGDNVLDHSLTSSNLNTVHNIIGFVNINTTGWNYFAARAANGRYYPNNNTAYPENLTTGKIMLRFSASGWFGDSWSGSTGIIDIVADGNWNKTSTPTKIDFSTTGISGSVTKRMSILKNGSVIITGLSGAGNAYTCVAPDGMLYRGTPGC